MGRQGPEIHFSSKLAMLMERREIEEAKEIEGSLQNDTPRTKKGWKTEENYLLISQVF